MYKNNVFGLLKKLYEIIPKKKKINQIFYVYIQDFELEH